jgi:hypothetical protein
MWKVAQSAGARVRMPCQEVVCPVGMDQPQGPLMEPGNKPLESVSQSTD